MDINSQFDNFIGVLEDVKYVEEYQAAAKYSRLKKRLAKHSSTLEFLEQKLSESVSPSEHPELWSERCSEILDITDPELKAIQGLNFLKKILDNDEIEDYVFQLAWQVSIHYSRGDRYQMLFESLIQPIIDYINDEVVSRDARDGSFISSMMNGMQESISSQWSTAANAVIEQNKLIICKPHFDWLNKGVDDNKVFVVSAFNPEFFEKIYPTIERSANKVDSTIEVGTAHLKQSSIIINDIWESICTARLIIADVTHNNFNAGYEVGMAHALGKKVIFLFDKSHSEKGKAPFDIGHFRRIEYSLENLNSLEDELQDWLRVVWNEEVVPYPVYGINLNVVMKDDEETS